MFAKFAPSNILENLDEIKKNCLVVVGIETVQICTIKDDINNSCKNDGTDKIKIKLENGIDLHNLDHIFNSKSLFSEKRLFEIDVADGIIKKEIKEILLQKIKEYSDDYFIFYFKKHFKDYKKQNWFELLKNYCLLLNVEEPNNEQLLEAIKHRIKLHQISMTNEAKKLLVNYSMGNLIQAENDIKKLKLIYPNQEINEKIISDHITNGSRHDGFKFN